MKPTPEIEATGLRAYEQAAAFERIRTWRLPLTYAFFPIIPFIIAEAAWKEARPNIAMAYFALAIGLIIMGFGQWRRQSARYAENIKLLAELEQTYGDQLPWVQVENHFAALEKLEEDIAQEKRKETEQEGRNS